MNDQPSIYFRDINERQGSFLRRTLLMGGGALLGLGALGARLAHLQLIEAHRYTVAAVENQFNDRLQTPPRGRILDRQGVVLAGNRPSFTDGPVGRGEDPGLGQRTGRNLCPLRHSLVERADGTEPGTRAGDARRRDPGAEVIPRRGALSDAGTVLVDAPGTYGAVHHHRNQYLAAAVLQVRAAPVQVEQLFRFT